MRRTGRGSTARGERRRAELAEVKALKTGCGLEKAQLETAHGLTVLLGIVAVLAARLPDLKLLARARPDETVTADPLAPGSLAVPAAPSGGAPAGGWTNRTVLHAVARLGGFVGRNSDGDPGWITLWRGMLRLLDLCAGYALAGSG